MKLLPWPGRAERRARISAASTAAREAREDADEAQEIGRDLQRILAENHFAEILLDSLTGGKRP